VRAHCGKSPGQIRALTDFGQSRSWKRISILVPGLAIAGWLLFAMISDRDDVIIFHGLALIAALNAGIWLLAAVTTSPLGRRERTALTLILGAVGTWIVSEALWTGKGLLDGPLPDYYPAAFYPTIPGYLFLILACFILAKQASEQSPDVVGLMDALIAGSTAIFVTICFSYDRLQDNGALDSADRWVGTASPILASVAMVLAHIALQRSNPNVRRWWVLAAVEVAIAAQILGTIVLIGITSQQKSQYVPWVIFIWICGFAVMALAGRFAMAPPNPTRTNSLFQRAMIWRTTPLAMTAATFVAAIATYDQSNRGSDRTSTALLGLVLILLLVRLVVSNRVGTRLQERTHERDALDIVLEIAQRPQDVISPEQRAFELADDVRRLVKTRGAAILVWDSADERIIEAYSGLTDEEFAELRAHSNGAPFSWLQSRTGTLTPVRALVNDLWVSVDLADAFRRFRMEKFGLAPMSVGQDRSGVIALWTPEIDVTLDRFPDRALMLIGRQAGLQLQNAHLLTIERQRTQERAQLSRVISAANDMRDLPIALRKIARRTLGIGGIDRVRVFTYEAISASLTITAIAGDDRDEHATLARRIPLESLPLAAHAVYQRRTLTVSFGDARGNVTPADHDVPTTVARMIVTPMLVGSELVGVLECSSMDAKAFQLETPLLIEEIAQATGLAVQNAGLVASLRRQSDERSALVSIGRIVSGATDLSRALDAIAESCLHIENVEGVDIELLPDEGYPPISVSVARRANWSSPAGEHHFFPIVQWPSTMRVIESRQAALYTNESEDLRPHERAMLKEDGIGAMALMPIIVGERTIGVLEFFNQQIDAFQFSITNVGSEIAAQIAQLIERTRLQDALRHQATIDSLTGVHTRRAILAELEIALAKARSDRGLLAIVMIDMNNFKEINDSLGHAAGDAVLAETARHLQDAVAGEGHIGRYGGDEFVVVLPGHDDESALAVVQRMRINVGPTASFSCGVAIFPRDGIMINSLLQSADEEMYASKRGSKA
jgi:diguanylate cyclase (GGDEF)-like protein